MFNFVSIGKYLTHKELFYSQAECSENEIIEFISSKNSCNLLIGLSALSRLSYEKLDNIRNDFLIYMKSKTLVFNEKALYDCSMIVMPKSIMVAMKWVIKYGDFKAEKNVTDITYTINECVLLCCMVADSFDLDIVFSDGDFMTSLENMAPDLLRDCYLNSINSGDGIGYLRALYFYRELIDDNDLKHEVDYIDFRKLFALKYGYSIFQYIGVMIFFMVNFSTPFSYGENIDDTYLLEMSRKGFNAEIISRVMQHHMIGVKDAKKEMEHNYKINWAIDFFWRYMFFKINEQKKLLLVPSAFKSNIFLSIKFEIQKVFSENAIERNNFLSFFGKMQEKYIVNVLRESTKIYKGLNVIPEFLYKSGNNKSPDAIVEVGSLMLVFESKGQALKKQSIFSGNNDQYVEDEVRLAVNPLKQALRSLEELSMCNQKHIDIKKHKKIYLFSVTTSNTKFNPYGQKKSVI